MSLQLAPSVGIFGAVVILRPTMVGLGSNLEESMGSQCQEHFVNLECRRDRDVSVHTTYNSKSQSRSGSHLSHEENTKAMQLEIDHLKRKLCHEWRR